MYNEIIRHSSQFHLLFTCLVLLQLKGLRRFAALIDIGKDSVCVVLSLDNGLHCVSALVTHVSTQSGRLQL